MGDLTSIQKKAAETQAATLNQQEDAVQMKAQQAAPSFSLTASTAPAQLKKKKKEPKAAPAPPTQQEIDDKIAELENDVSIIKPGETWTGADREDDKYADAAAKREGIKRKLKTYNADFCGTVVNNMNIYCKDKIDKVNAAFNAIADPATKKAITESIQVAGGFNYRVMTGASPMDNSLKRYGLKGYKKLSLSDHAMGCAIDVNANKGTMQNTHFKKPKEKLKSEKSLPKGDRLLLFMESIIQKYDSSFDLDKTEGVDHLRGLNSISKHLNTYVNTLLGNASPVDIFANEVEIKQGLKDCKTDKGNCNMILANWEILKGYAYGTRLEKVPKMVKGERRMVDKITVLDGKTPVDPANPDNLELKGVIDMNETFLQIMIDSGWKWGGSTKDGFGRGNKDYMHFEDRDAMELMKTPEKSK